MNDTKMHDKDLNVYLGQQHNCLYLIEGQSHFSFLLFKAMFIQLWIELLQLFESYTLCFVLQVCITPTKFHMTHIAFILSHQPHLGKIVMVMFETMCSTRFWARDCTFEFDCFVYIYSLTLFLVEQFDIIFCYCANIVWKLRL